MTKPFKRIALVGRRHPSPEVIESVKQIISLLEQNGYDYAVENDTVSSCDFKTDKLFAIDALGDEWDLLIAIGGDGCLLHAAHAAVQANTPVLGINRGRLGFLTDISPQEITTRLLKILQGDYITEPRFMLHATLGKTELGIALNDIVLIPGKMPHMVSFITHIDHKLVASQRADGIIITTPTGSTAYALAGGGPILHPHLNAVALVPMMPHTLSSRPIVVNADVTIEIEVTEDNEYAPCVSLDGLEPLCLNIGDKILIRKHKDTLNLIHPTDYHYYHTLRSKLGWEKSQTA